MGPRGARASHRGEAGRGRLDRIRHGLRPVAPRGRHRGGRGHRDRHRPAKQRARRGRAGRFCRGGAGRFALHLRASGRGGRRLSAPGEVFLVGTGPGDPDLLTVKALRLIREAQVVLYDNLVSEEILALVPASAERIYVGKRRSDHAMRQEAINELLVKLAREGRRVLRLKAGDPFVFGRGGEEIETLGASGVRFEVVPGITAALGAAAYAGIPLTHRDYAQSCVFVTGNTQDGALNVDWAAIVRPRQTVVIYMGFQNLGELCRELIAHGLPPLTPAAMIQQATTSSQRVVSADLATLAERAHEAGLKPPTLIIVGEVVRLRERLEWFDTNRAADNAPKRG
ncbi:MAG: uroporphyrinogen-III C-methyltransferase [Betaproteobacteria bacterium]|nr:uroporphyrinogen-III C-methyltransferase [Betaproteobacteria bacterium]